MSDADPNANRSTTPKSTGFTEYISRDWAEREVVHTVLTDAARAAAPRRDELSRLFPGTRLVLPAGGVKSRSNDDDYRYRAHSAFSYATGWGADTVPDSVLVFEPTSTGHDVTLFIRPTADRTTEEFYADASIGEFWVGARPGLTEVSGALGLRTQDLAEFADVRAAWSGPTAVIREADPALTKALDAVRGDGAAELDADFTRAASEQRLVKDAYEVGEMRAAIASTSRAFDDVLEQLPRIVAASRGERIIEGVFYTRARLEGNDVGYGSIAAAGAHATILHWTRNDGAVRDGQLVLLDAGVERESFYTADITRTFPVNGTFSPVQRRVYEAVLEAADAAFAVVKPGIIFREVHAAAMHVIAAKTAEWGLLPVSAEESLDPENQFHRRYMVHGTSHHLGIDVHDCAQARKEFYMDGEVREGMIFTIEPGLYFQPDDLTVPEEYRGIGVRIEDNILVTATGAENLSAGIPRRTDEVEAWVQRFSR